MTFTLPPKNEKPLTAKKFPPYCITAKQLPPYCITAEKILPLPPKSLPPTNEKPPTAKELPPKKYRHSLVYPFRQSRYRQERETRQPPENYRRMAIPPRLCPPKKPLPMTALVFLSVNPSGLLALVCRTCRTQYDGTSFFCLLCLLR